MPWRGRIRIVQHSVRVTDGESGEELPTETVGVIEVKGPNVFDGLLAGAGNDKRRIPQRRLLHHQQPRQDRRQGLCPRPSLWQGPSDLRAA